MSYSVFSKGIDDQAITTIVVLDLPRCVDSKCSNQGEYMIEFGCKPDSLYCKKHFPGPPYYDLQYVKLEEINYQK